MFAAISRVSPSLPSLPASGPFIPAEQDSFEDGGIVGPRGSPTPTPTRRMFMESIFEEGGIVGPRGSATPKPPIFENGGIVGPRGSPTPRLLVA